MPGDELAQTGGQDGGEPRHALGDDPADEIVVDDLVEFVGLGGRQRERHVQVDVDQHALLATLLEVVHADVDPDLVVAQEQAPAVHQARVVDEALHQDAFTVSRARNMTSRDWACRCWPPSTSSVVPVMDWLFNTKSTVATTSSTVEERPSGESLCRS